MAQDTSTLQAQVREKSGKGPAHRLRAKGLVPAVCYGRFEKQPLTVAIDPDALVKAIETPHKFNTVIKLEVSGSEPRTVLFKEHEKDPVDGHILHVAFLEVRMDHDVLLNAPAALIGKPVGVRWCTGRGRASAKGWRGGQGRQEVSARAPSGGPRQPGREVRAHAPQPGVSRRAAGGREAGHGVGPDPLERGAGHGQGTGGA